MKKLYLTFDVEPCWLDIPVQHTRAEWSSFDRVSYEQTMYFADLCKANDWQCTFFIVGAWAQQFPNAVRRLKDLGFDIGSHSYWHEDLSLLNRRDFLAEVILSKNVLEDIIGDNVDVFRAPSFSIHPWQIDILAEAGFKRDSSITYGARYKGKQKSQYKISSEIVEYSMRGWSVLGNELTILGGGYLRIIPTTCLKFMKTLDLGNMLYLHPHDLPSQIDLSNYGHISRFNKTKKKIRNGSMIEKLHILAEENQFVDLT
ncbi:polysaccharide deacetylase family protein [Planktomarina temperata]|nr:polysaccharide deacetylase family protein [Planktomarina temperata]